MERDARRDRGQWKGCYNLSGLADDRAGSRDGGLKMGNTYYYYVSARPHPSPPPPPRSTKN